LDYATLLLLRRCRSTIFWIKYNIIVVEGARN